MIGSFLVFGLLSKRAGLEYRLRGVQSALATSLLIKRVHPRRRLEAVSVFRLRLFGQGCLAAGSIGAFLFLFCSIIF